MVLVRSVISDVLNGVAFHIPFLGWFVDPPMPVVFRRHVSCMLVVCFGEKRCFLFDMRILGY